MVAMEGDVGSVAWSRNAAFSFSNCLMRSAAAWKPSIGSSGTSLASLDFYITYKQYITPVYLPDMEF